MEKLIEFSSKGLNYATNEEPIFASKGLLNLVLVMGMLENVEMLSPTRSEFIAISNQFITQ